MREADINEKILHEYIKVHNKYSVLFGNYSISIKNKSKGELIELLKKALDEDAETSKSSRIKNQLIQLSNYNDPVFKYLHGKLSTREHVVDLMYAFDKKENTSILS
jgi:hypothetical protein